MDNQYLQELIREARKREGGLILNLDEKPAVVVLTIDKYNALVGGLNTETAKPQVPVPQGQKRQAETGPGGSGKVLVTGGAGYIGSHVARKMLENNYEVVVVDNLSTGKRENVPAGAIFFEGDLADVNFMRDVFAAHQVEAVMHLAASIEVEESVREPEKYFQNNAVNTLSLLSVMNEFGVKKIIFSSTCALYDPSGGKPLSEESGVNPANPYGYTKFVAEKTIEYYTKYLGFSGVVFRYFNASGCDFDGQIKPTHESHLIPSILEVANGKRPQIKVNGNDYGTADGTCVRDYIHVLDIARAHVLALKRMKENESFEIFNLGTGHGYSVLEMINATAEVLNRMIPMEIGPRRPGDADLLVANSEKAKRNLGFEVRYSDLPTIIETAWKQYQQN
ncbi:MAG: UDP-glucose 4-epimerase GalE [Patescibacteria group bacterium]|nr:UDP-glucose 4-epimerase GalE [Patescibacteria group bacterium]